MKIINEFKTFAMKGNVIDLAIGIIIGSAFGKIVGSIVNDIIMPPIGLIVGGVKFSDLKFVMKEAIDGNPAVTLNYGNFLQVTFDFLIVAFSIFMLIKAMNSAKKKQEEVPLTPSVLSKTEILLTEIRDSLKKNN